MRVVFPTSNPLPRVAMDHAQSTRENERRVLDAELAGALEVPGLPIRFNLELTADCNLHCRMCACEITRQDCRRRGLTDFHMPLDQFRAAVARVFPLCSILNPSLVGEPLVLPYLDELIDAAREYAVRLDIVTNGVLLDAGMSRRLLPVLSGMMLSVDGATRETFEGIRNGASHARVMANLAHFSRLRRELGLGEEVQLSFSVALMQENIRELLAIVELAARHQVDRIVASHLVVFRPSLLGSSLIHRPELAESFLAAARRRAEELGVEVCFPAPLQWSDRAALLKVERGTDLEGKEGVPPAPGDGPLGTVPTPAPSEEHGDTRSVPATPSAAADPLPAAPDRDEPLPKTAITLNRPARWPGRYYCKFPWREVFVSLGGEVSPCCAQGRPVFGNAFETDIEEIWNGPGYRRLRRGLFDGDLTSYCRQCTYLQESGYLDYDSATYPRLND